jgi:hypothetical protein
MSPLFSRKTYPTDIATRQNALLVGDKAPLATGLLFFLGALCTGLGLGAWVVIFKGVGFPLRTWLVLPVGLGLPLLAVFWANRMGWRRALRRRIRRLFQLAAVFGVTAPVIFFASLPPESFTSVVGGVLALYDETLGDAGTMDGVAPSLREDIAQANARLLLSCPGGTVQKIKTTAGFREAFCLDPKGQRQGTYFKVAGGLASDAELIKKNAILVKGRYAAGKREGVFRFFNRDGKKLSEATYQNGEVISGAVVQVE